MNATGKVRLVLTCLLAIHAVSARAIEVVPGEAGKLPVLELGKAVALLLPDRAEGQIGWAHRADGPVAWVTEGYRMQRWADGTNVAIRDGLMRIRLDGKMATVLKKANSELAWTVSYTSTVDPKFGVEAISLHPGTDNEICFGSTYSGCAFDPVKSLRQAGISVKVLCNSPVPGGSAMGLELSAPGRRTTMARVSQQAGSGGATTDFTLLLASPPKALCTG
jgi:hypothetical protein